MIAVDDDRFMDNPDLFMDKSADCGPVLVEGENHKSIVMLSEDAYSNLMENLHVPGGSANYEWLMESKRQLEEGRASAHELIAVDDD